MEELGWKNGQLLWPLRVALTGTQYSPGAFEMLWTLGKEESIKRINQKIDSLLSITFLHAALKSLLVPKTTHVILILDDRYIPGLTQSLQTFGLEIIYPISTQAQPEAGMPAAEVHDLTSLPENWSQLTTAEDAIIARPAAQQAPSVDSDSTKQLSPGHSSAASLPPHLKLSLEKLYAECGDQDRR